MVAGGVPLGLLAMWWHGGLAPDWGPNYFWLSAVMLPAWTLLALCLGVLAGAAVRRVVPAMAAALAVVIIATFAGTGSGLIGRWPPGLGTLGSLLQVAPVTAGGLPPPMSYHSTLTAAFNGTPFYLAAGGGRLRGFSATGGTIWAGRPGWIVRHVYLPASNFGPHDSWVLSSWFTGPGGSRLGPHALQQLANRIPLRLVIWPGRGLPGWLAARHVTYWTSYIAVWLAGRRG